MRLTRILLILTILSLSSNALAQIGYPVLKSFNITQHGGEKQVFDAVADSSGVMYFANANGGLVIFDGNSWDILKTESAVKSLCYNDDDNLVYVGCGNNLGVLRPSENGQYQFETLISKIPEECQTFGDVTNILYSKKEGVVFQTTDYLFLLKGDSIRVINGKTPSHAGYVRMFKCGDRIFAVHQLNGIKEISGGREIDHPEMDQAGQGLNILYIYSHNGKIRIASLKKGILEVNGGECTPVNEEFSAHLLEIRENVDQMIQTSSGCIIYNDRNFGIVVTDSEFNVLYTTSFTESVNKLYEDSSRAIWICSNNKAATRLDIYHPYKFYYQSKTSILGSIKSIFTQGDNLYLGADALYQTSLSGLDTLTQRLRELKSDKGYTGMWSMDTIDGQIYGGSNKGLFTVSPQNKFINIDKIDEFRNIFRFKQACDNPDIIVGVGGQSGISAYQKNNGRWEYKVGVDGGPDNFQKKSRYIETDCDGYYWVSDKSSGVFRLKFNAAYDTVLSAEYFDQSKGLPSDKDNYLFRSDRGIVVATVNGIYKYDKENGMMVEDGRLNKIFGGKKEFNLLYYDGAGSFWTKHVVSTKDGNIFCLERYRLTSDSTAECVTNQLEIFQGNVYSFGYIGGSKYIIGSDTLFTIYDSKPGSKFNTRYKALIRKVESIQHDTVLYGGYGIDGQESMLSIPFSDCSVRITLAATSFLSPEETQFSTYLENYNDNWSVFRNENYKEYSNLWPGRYTMHVIAKNSYGVLSEEGTFTFEILPPWYLTTWAYILFALLLVLLVWGIVKAYTQKLVRDKQKLEAIVEERTSEIREQSQLIMDQNKTIVEKNKSITDSINYAKHIQNAMLPLPERITMALPEHFILFRPKDIVSGDYYWFAETEKYIIITAADCTGHGVPGAFMSMIGSQILTEIVAEGITSPDEILTNQNRRIRKALKQETTENHDGMDMALCTIHRDSRLVEFAGAKNQLIVIKNGELTEYKADKQSIGGSQMYGDDFKYQKTAIQTDGNTWFYMFSDGYKDQFGGPENSKFMIKRLRQLLMDIHDKPASEQREILNTTIQNWIDQGRGEQTDDIILIGFKQ